MPGKIFIIWDYDTAIGQVNSSYPYNFNEEKLLEEIANVEKILEIAREFEVRMTFACVGFAAEPGHYPYHVPDQIRKIFSQGHEIASHSWRHEWFPYLQREQIEKSLVRSKHILEECLGAPGAVKGFVPPFSRPMSWYSRGAFSFGDRVFGPWYPGASYGTLLPFIRDAGYKWCRVAYYPIWQKLSTDRMRNRSIRRAWLESNEVLCVPQHYTGFDDVARSLMRTATDGGSVILVGHPSGLTRNNTENIEHLRDLLHELAEYQQSGSLVASTVSSSVISEKSSQGESKVSEIVEARDENSSVL
jgi:hypothetical protein